MGSPPDILIIIMDLGNAFITALYGTAFVVSAGACINHLVQYTQAKWEITEYENQIWKQGNKIIEAKDVTESLHKKAVIIQGQVLAKETKLANELFEKYKEVPETAYFNAKKDVFVKHVW